MATPLWEAKFHKEQGGEFGETITIEAADAWEAAGKAWDFITSWSIPAVDFDLKEITQARSAVRIGSL